MKWHDCQQIDLYDHEAIGIARVLQQIGLEINCTNCAADTDIDTDQQHAGRRLVDLLHPQHITNALLARYL